MVLSPKLELLVARCFDKVHGSFLQREKNHKSGLLGIFALLLVSSGHTTNLPLIVTFFITLLGNQWEGKNKTKQKEHKKNIKWKT